MIRYAVNARVAIVLSVTYVYLPDKKASLTELLLLSRTNKSLSAIPPCFTAPAVRSASYLHISGNSRMPPRCSILGSRLWLHPQRAILRPEFHPALTAPASLQTLGRHPSATSVFSFISLLICFVKSDICFSVANFPISHCQTAKPVLY